MAPLSISLPRGNVCVFSLHSTNVVICKKPKTAYTDLAFALDTRFCILKSTRGSKLMHLPGRGF